MKFRKGSVADVLWFIGLLTVCLVLVRTQMEYSNTATIDTYVKNTLNAEVTKFASSAAGFSFDDAYCNIYNSNGDKRRLGSVSDAPLDPNSNPRASAFSVVKYAEKEMIKAIEEEFNSNENLKTKTKGFSASNLEVKWSNASSKNLLVTVTLKYTVTNNAFTGSTGGFVKKSNMEIPRKVVVTRAIENPLHFK